MSVYKREGIYHIDISVGGKRIRESTGTSVKRDAQAYHDRRKNDLWKVIKLKEKPRRLWKEAAIKWFESNQHKRSIASDQRRLRILDDWLKDLYLDEIDKELIETIKRERSMQFKRDAQGRETAKTVTPAEVNRMLALLRSILNAACDDWEWIERVPKVKLLREPKKRIRYLTKVEAMTLYENLPDHLKPIFRFSLVTGLREQNVLKLKLSQVDLENRTLRVDADKSKNGRPFAIPLNSEAVDVLLNASTQHDGYVFTFRGKPLYRANNSAWRTALKNSGIEDFKWHDIRHTWASWLVQAGTPLNIVQELGGWESIEMVQRYAHLAPSTLLDASNRNQGLGLAPSASREQNTQKMNTPSFCETRNQTNTPLIQDLTRLIRSSLEGSNGLK